MMLADMTGLESAGIICSIILGSVGSIASIISLLKKQEVKVDQPLEVQFAAEFVHRKEFEDQAAAVSQLSIRITTVEKELTSKISAMSTELHATELRLAAGGEQRVSLLHGRINELLEAVGEIKGQLKPK